MIVQVGRFDAKTANAAAATTRPAIDWEAPTGDSVREAFAAAGLGPREAALLLGSLGEMNRVVAEAASKKGRETNDEDDEEFEVI